MKSRDAKRVGWNASDALIVTCLLMLAVASGCSDSGSKRQRVTGSVSFRGTPVKSGTISFFPSGTGAVAGANIVDGDFDVPESKGLLPGEYRVEIESWMGTGVQVQGDPDAPDSAAEGRRQVIPDKFNVNSELKEIVSGSHENVFDFTLVD